VVTAQVGIWRHVALSRRLNAYVDRELPRHQAQQVGVHARGCWRCAGRIETLRRIKQATRRMGRSSVDALTAARLHRFAREIPIGSAG
jgi:anti-sigma factor RsiW